MIIIIDLFDKILIGVYSIIQLWRIFCGSSSVASYSTTNSSELDLLLHVIRYFEMNLRREGVIFMNPKSEEPWTIIIRWIQFFILQNCFALNNKKLSDLILYYYLLSLIHQIILRREGDYFMNPKARNLEQL